MAEKLSLMVECEQCHEKFGLDQESVNLVQKKEFIVNGRSIYLTYYDCLSCGKRHYVQIDDTKSLAMLDENRKQFVHNAALKTRGQKLRKKKVDQYKGTKKHLSNYRNELMKEFDGSIIHDAETGSDFTLRFSV